MRENYAVSITISIKQPSSVDPQAILNRIIEVVSDQTFPDEVEVAFSDLDECESTDEEE